MKKTVLAVIATLALSTTAFAGEEIQLAAAIGSGASAGAGGGAGMGASTGAAAGTAATTTAAAAAASCMACRRGRCWDWRAVLKGAAMN